jgi:hypothetical protein
MAVVFALSAFMPHRLSRGGRNRRGVFRCSCLSECYLLASSAAAPTIASDEGTAHVFYERLRRRGVFFFGYFLLDKQKKVTRQQGEKQCHAVLQMNQ